MKVLEVWALLCIVGYALAFRYACPPEAWCVPKENCKDDHSVNVYNVTIASGPVTYLCGIVNTEGYVCCRDKGLYNISKDYVPTRRDWFYAKDNKTRVIKGLVVLPWPGYDATEIGVPVRRPPAICPSYSVCVPPAVCPAVAIRYTSLLSDAVHKYKCGHTWDTHSWSCCSFHIFINAIYSVLRTNLPRNVVRRVGAGDVSEVVKHSRPYPVLSLYRKSYHRPTYHDTSRGRKVGEEVEQQEETTTSTPKRKRRNISSEDGPDSASTEIFTNTIEVENDTIIVVSESTPFEGISENTSDASGRSAGGPSGRPLPPDTGCGKPIGQSPAAAAPTTSYSAELINSGITTEGQYPWHVAILSIKMEYLCGGTIVSDRHAVTVAHCIDVFTASDLRVRVGDYDLTGNTEKYTSYDVELSHIVFHPNYTRPNLKDDLAVLVLKYPVLALPNVARVCFPGEVTQTQREECRVPGWGSVTPARKGSPRYTNFHPVLKDSGFVLVGREQCQYQLRKVNTLGSFFKLLPGVICVKGIYQTDSCHGDGGSGMVCRTNAGEFVLEGLISWSVGCDRGLPTALVDIAHYASFIFHVIHGTTFQGSTSFNQGVSGGLSSPYNVDPLLTGANFGSQSSSSQQSSTLHQYSGSSSSQQGSYSSAQGSYNAQQTTYGSAQQGGLNAQQTTYGSAQQGGYNAQQATYGSGQQGGYNAQQATYGSGQQGGYNAQQATYGGVQQGYSNQQTAYGSGQQGYSNQQTAYGSGQQGYNTQQTYGGAQQSSSNAYQTSYSNAQHQQTGTYSSSSTTQSGQSYSKGSSSIRHQATGTKGHLSSKYKPGYGSHRRPSPYRKDRYESRYDEYGDRYENRYEDERYKGHGGYGNKHDGYGDKYEDYGVGHEYSKNEEDHDGYGDQYDSKQEGYDDEYDYDRKHEGYGNKYGYDSKHEGYGNNYGDDREHEGYGDQYGGYDSKHEGYGDEYDGYDSKYEGDGYASKHEGYGNKYNRYGDEYEGYGDEYDGYDSKYEGDGYASKHEGYGNKYDQYDSKHEGYGNKYDGYDSKHEGYSERYDGYDSQHEGYGDKYDGYDTKHEGYGDKYDGYDSKHEGYGDKYDGSDSKHEGYGDKYDGSDSKHEGYDDNKHEGYGDKYDGYGDRYDGYSNKHDGYGDSYDQYGDDQYYEEAYNENSKYGSHSSYKSDHTNYKYESKHGKYDSKHKYDTKYQHEGNYKKLDRYDDEYKDYDENDRYDEYGSRIDYYEGFAGGYDGYNDDDHNEGRYGEEYYDTFAEYLDKYDGHQSEDGSERYGKPTYGSKHGYSKEDIKYKHDYGKEDKYKHDGYSQEELNYKHNGYSKDDENYDTKRTHRYDEYNSQDGYSQSYDSKHTNKHESYKYDRNKYDFDAEHKVWHEKNDQKYPPHGDHSSTGYDDHSSSRYSSTTSKDHSSTGYSSATSKDHSSTGYSSTTSKDHSSTGYSSTTSKDQVNQKNTYANAAAGSPGYVEPYARQAEDEESDQVAEGMSVDAPGQGIVGYLKKTYMTKETE